MSAETAQWLAENVKVGFTDKRGSAWHRQWEGPYAAASAANHYPGAIPVEDVREWFKWTPEESTVFVNECEMEDPLKLLQGLVVPGESVRLTYDQLAEIINKVEQSYVPIPGRKAIVPSYDPSYVFGIFSEKYQPHGYEKWLLDNVIQLLGGDLGLGISSVGFLRNRAVAWVEISVPDTMHTPSGFDFRPNLLATTSFDGTSATIYKRTICCTVCDNTRHVALGETGEVWKNKHSKYSHLKLDVARETLNLFSQMEVEFRTLVETHTRIELTMAQFDKIMADLFPAPGDSAKQATARTKHQAQMEQMRAMYLNDDRVNKWSGTAFGVEQLVNTWYQHERPVRGETLRPERNRHETIKSDIGRNDDATWAAIVKQLDGENGDHYTESLIEKFQKQLNSDIQSQLILV